MTTYKIIRFRFQGENTVLLRGITLEQAQAHCQSEATHDIENDPPLWFDGYEAE